MIWWPVVWVYLHFYTECVVFLFFFFRENSFAEKVSKIHRAICGTGRRRRIFRTKFSRYNSRNNANTFELSKLAFKTFVSYDINSHFAYSLRNTSRCPNARPWFSPFGREQHIPGLTLNVNTNLSCPSQNESLFVSISNTIYLWRNARFQRKR